MIDTKIFTETIDDVTYRMRPLPPRVALHFLHRILQIAAPGIGSAVDGLGGNIGDVMSASVEKIGLGTLIGGALERLTAKDLDWANDLLAKQCEIVKGPNEAPRLIDVFDVHFQGRIRHWFAWFKWAAKSQFSDFFDGSAQGAGPPHM